MLRIVVGCLVPVLLAGCTVVGDIWPLGELGFDSTYRKVMARAERGDAESQNAAGYMLFYGEGVQADRVQAHLWFRRAADQGHARAQRNLAVMGVLGPEVHAPSFSLQTARVSAEGAPPGEQSYLTFCSGCHGVNGIAAYENSPSFAFGERLEKTDAILMRSLLNGMQEMPGWEGKLPRQSLREVLAFVRTLQSRYDAGIAGTLRSTPGYYYLFGPMEQRRQAGLL